MSTKRLADELLNKHYSNPFSDIKNVISTPINKMQNEFVPTKIFWSLFNNQNEVVIGARGSGKTILFRMMAYSMLKMIDDDAARLLVKEKRYFALYVPMDCDLVESISNYDLDQKEQEKWFNFSVNCLIALSLIDELKSILEDYPKECQSVLEYNLTDKISRMWDLEEKLKRTDLAELKFVVRQLFSKQDRYCPLDKSVPGVFESSIGVLLEAVVDIISDTLNFEDKPTWIVCIDEAEYLKDSHIDLISKKMRSNMYHITIKIADLPYYHSISNPSGKGEHAIVGHDYIKTVLKVEDSDFARLTDTLCKVRLQDLFQTDDITLENFLGKEGKDDYLDYYKKEFGTEKVKSIHNDITEQISPSRRETLNKPNRTERVNNQSIYKKLAPILYVREMKRRAGKGNFKLTWFAGANMVRRIAQSNPRIFLRIMGHLFSVALEKKLEPDIQSEVIGDFSEKVHNETRALEKYGDTAHDKLEKIGEALATQVHEGYLKECGNTFRLSESVFQQERDWLIVAIAYSRVFVEDLEEVDSLSSSVLFSLSNIYSVKYWLPMRKNSSSPILSLDAVDDSHTVNKSKEGQINAD